MNRRLVQLNFLLQLKRKETRDAFNELLKIKEHFKSNKEKHSQLSGYRSEYMQQIETIGKEGTTIERIINRVNFINYLESALVTLNGLLAEIALTRTEMEKKYKKAKIAEEAIVKLIERANQEVALDLVRQEQKESDEYAQKKWFSKQSVTHHFVPSKAKNHQYALTSNNQDAPYNDQDGMPAGALQKNNEE